MTGLLQGKRQGRWLPPLLALLLISFSAQSCSEEKPRIVKLAVVAPFSGRYYATGSNILFAVKLAVEEWNSRKGAGGYRINVVAQDDRNDAEGGALQARKMVVDPDVVGVVGHVSRASILAAAGEYQKAEMPALALGAMPETLAQRHQSMLGTAAGESIVTGGIARFVSEGGFRSVALVADGSTPQDESEFIKAALAEHNIAARETRIDITSNLREAARRILASSPDLVLFTGSFVGGADLLKEIRTQGSKIAYLGGYDHALPDFLSVGGDATEGAYYVSLALHPGDLPAAASFAPTYKAEFGVEPTSWAAIAYDASNIMLTAVEQAVRRRGRPNRMAVMEALANIKEYSGITGNLSPSAKGNLSDPKVYIYRIASLNFPGELRWSGGGS